MIRPVTGSFRRPRTYPEEILQKQTVQFLELALDPSWTMFFHVPNQKGTRKGWEVGLLKAMGVKNGMADLVICWRDCAESWGPAACVGFIELKAGSPQSDDQKAVEAQCAAICAPYAICHSVEAVEDTLRGWGLPLRATLLPSGVTKRTDL